MNFYKMMKTCNQKFKICTLMYPCDGCHDVQTAWELFHGDAQGTYEDFRNYFTYVESVIG